MLEQLKLVRSILGLGIFLKNIIHKQYKNILKEISLIIFYLLTTVIYKPSEYYCICKTTYLIPSLKRKSIIIFCKLTYGALAVKRCRSIERFRTVTIWIKGKRYWICSTVGSSTWPSRTGTAGGHTRHWYNRVGSLYVSTSFGKGANYGVSESGYSCKHD